MPVIADAVVEERRLATCAHEAGHVGLAFVLGWRINGASALAGRGGYADVGPVADLGIATSLEWIDMYLIGDAYFRTVAAQSDETRKLYGIVTVKRTIDDLIDVPSGASEAERSVFDGLRDYRKRKQNDLDYSREIAEEISSSPAAANAVMTWRTLEVADRLRDERFQKAAARATELLELHGEVDGATLTAALKKEKA